MAVREKITIKVQSRPDRFGETTTTSSVVVSGCRVWPRTGDDPATGALTVIEGQNVHIPQGKPLPRASDIIELRGAEYEVVGVPAVFPGKGAIVVLQKVGAP